MVQFGLGIIVPVLSAIGFLVLAIRQVHYVRRNDAVTSGLGLIANGISLIIFNPNLFVYVLPLALFPLVQAFAGIGLTVRRINIGQEIILRGWTCFAMSIFIIVIQLLR